MHASRACRKTSTALRTCACAQGRDGKWFELEAEGLLAVAIQHEYDHLQGVLYIDKAKETYAHPETERLKKKAS